MPCRAIEKWWVLRLGEAANCENLLTAIERKPTARVWRDPWKLRHHSPNSAQ